MNSLYNQLNQNPTKPTIGQIIEEVNKSGMTAQELFYKKAKEMGVDPSKVLGNMNINDLMKYMR